MQVASPRVNGSATMRALCACTGLDPDDLTIEEIGDRLVEIANWDELIQRAEQNGLAPLVYWHARRIARPIPTKNVLTLRALYTRNRHLSEIRFATLANVLQRLEAQGMRLLVLKGAALANLIYPEPGLRPMGDLDVLVDPRHLDQAVKVLGDLGFTTVAKTEGLGDKHVVFTANVNGTVVRLELHHRLYSPGSRSKAEASDPPERGLQFSVCGWPGATLPPEAFLGHICNHLVGHTTVFLGVRLIWVADIIGFADHFAETIDWDRVASKQPMVLKVLSLLNAICPLPGKLLRAAPVRLGRTDSYRWGDFDGWPRASLASFRVSGKGYRRVAVDTFFPPTWWLRLHSGLASSDPLWPRRWVLHPLDMLGLTLRVVRERAELAARKVTHGSG